MELALRPIARIRSDFPEKFGIPRQAGLVRELAATVIFEPDFRNPDSLRGLESFSHIWLVWGFSAAGGRGWSPTVRPPRLGGNARMGVFATRSPFRPNPIAISPVQLDEIQLSSPEGPIIRVRGADLMDGTPIYDIKPYLPYVDSIAEAAGGFAAQAPEPALRVEATEALLGALPARHRAALLALLAQDPRPPYQDDSKRVYGMAYAGWEVKFTVEGQVLRVQDIRPAQENSHSKKQQE